MKKAFLSLLIAVATISAAPAAEVNLYTDRQEVFLRPVLAAFTKKTGIEVNILFAKKGLLERMRAEGEASPADVIMAVDAGRLEDFVNADLVSPHNDKALQKTVAAGLSTNNWIAVTRRARLLYVKKGGDIKTYADLALAKNKNTACFRSGLHTYNIALFADLIQRQGMKATKQWLNGVKANLARQPQGNDRAQILGVADGQCVAGVANSYYYSKLAADAETRQKMEETLDIVIPPDVHINVTGVAVAAHAPHRDNALALMRFLVSKGAQRIYADSNGEFPARDDVAFPADWAFARDAVQNAAPLADIARYRTAASRLVEEVGFDR